jgi:hypothetical protein
MHACKAPKRVKEIKYENINQILLYYTYFYSLAKLPTASRNLFIEMGRISYSIQWVVSVQTAEHILVKVHACMQSAKEGRCPAPSPHVAACSRVNTRYACFAPSLLHVARRSHVAACSRVNTRYACFAPSLLHVARRFSHTHAAGRFSLACSWAAVTELDGKIRGGH